MHRGPWLDAAMHSAALAAALAASSIVGDVPGICGVATGGSSIPHCNMNKNASRYALSMSTTPCCHTFFTHASWHQPWQCQVNTGEHNADGNTFAADTAQ